MKILKNSTWIPHFNPILITLIAFAINLHGLGHDSFWGDEILTVTIASQPWAELVRTTASDIHPPFYYLVASWFTSLLLSPDTAPSQLSDWAWRFPSVLAGTLAIPLTWRWARDAVNPDRFLKPVRARQVAFFTISLLAVTPLVVKYNQEARMHALFLALSMGATVCLWRAVITQNHRWWIGFSLLTVLNLYTVYFGFLVLTAHGAYIAARAGVGWLEDGETEQYVKKSWVSSLNPTYASNRELWGFSAATIGAFALYGPWWSVLFDLLARRAAVGAIEGGVGNPLTFLLGYISAIGPAPLGVAVLCVGLFVVGVGFLARRDIPLAIFVAGWIGLPAVLPIILGDPRALQFRYAFLLPIYLFGLSWAVHELLRKLVPNSQRPAVQQYLLWALVTVSIVSTLTVYQQTKPNWRAAAQILQAEASDNDLILIGPLWDEGRFIDYYYYHGSATRLTPAALVANIDEYAKSLRQQNGKVWAINRFAPASNGLLENRVFDGVVLSQATLHIYEPEALTFAALNLAEQAISAAQPWAEQAQAQGVLDPDPRTAKTLALKAYGDTLTAAGQIEQATQAYQTAVYLFPGWVTGYVTLAESYAQLDDPAQAVKNYRLAVQYQPTWQGDLAQQAEQLAQQARWAEALIIYQQLMP